MISNDFQEFYKYLLRISKLFREIFQIFFQFLIIFVENVEGVL